MSFNYNAIIGIYGEKDNVKELKCQVEELLVKLYGKENVHPTEIQKSKQYNNFAVRIYVNIPSEIEVTEFLPTTLTEEAEQR